MTPNIFDINSNNCNITQEQTMAAINATKDSFIYLTNGIIEIDKAHQQARINREIINISALLENFSEIESTLSSILKTDAPYFNIFSILKISHLEARVHTPFLCNLINPKGTHGQGRLFFELLIEKLWGSDFLINNRLTDIQVRQEERSDYGQIDLIIRFKANGKPHIIVIENKIYHHDEELQISRYNKKIKEEEKIPKSQYLIIYLTIDGKAPTERSIPKDEYNELVLNNTLVLWSYRRDIINLLYRALEKNQARNVNDLIQQYINIIQNL